MQRGYSVCAFLFLISILLISSTSAFILNPQEVKSGNYAGTTLNSSYTELVNAWFNPIQNTTQVFSSMIGVPWYQSDNVCTETNLQSGGNCDIGTVNLTQHCIVSDELSQVAMGLSMDTNATRFDLMYNTIRAINSTYGVIPSWKVVRNGTALQVCDSRTNGNCNTASDATARFILALFTASNNTAFNVNNRTRYFDLAKNMTEDMFAYELNHTTYKTQRSGNLTYWLSSGAVQRNAGLGSTDYSYSGYFADAALAFYQACGQLQNGTYCAVARNISYQYLEASQFNGTTFSVPPGRSFKWENITGVINATCTNTCSPPQWDSVDAPRAYGMGQVEYYSSNLVNYSAANLTTYMKLWRARYMTVNDSVPLQFNPNGTASASNQSGYFSQGLQALGLMGNVTGNGLVLFNQTLRSALAHYDSTPQSMDYASCFGVYGQTFPIRALGSAIGYDEDSFSPLGAGNQPNDAPRSFLQAPSNGSSFNFSTITFNATFTEDIELLNATLFIWNSTTLINRTNVSLSGLTGSANISVTLPRLGLYRWNYLVFDTNNNFSFNSTNWTFSYVDTATPIVSIVYPTASTYTSNVSTLNYTITDSFSLSTCWYSLDAGVTNSTITCGQNVSFLNTSDGNSYTWYVFSNDSSGNIGSASVSFSIDSGGADLETLCREELEGFQSFGDLLPMLIVGLMGGVALMFLMGKGEDFEATEDTTFGIVIATIVIAIGAPIIVTIFTSTLSGC